MRLESFETTCQILSVKEKGGGGIVRNSQTDLSAYRGRAHSDVIHVASRCHDIRDTRDSCFDDRYWRYLSRVSVLVIAREKRSTRLHQPWLFPPKEKLSLRIPLAAIIIGEYRPRFRRRGRNIRIVERKAPLIVEHIYSPSADR